jgi:hypothetical protein
MVIDGISVPLSNICSITLVSAFMPISSNFYFNSSVKSLEERVFPSSLSILVSRASFNPAILL